MVETSLSSGDSFTLSQLLVKIKEICEAVWNIEDILEHDSDPLCDCSWKKRR